jgi:hypothetical protein
MNRWVFPDAALYLIETRGRKGELVTDAMVTFGQLVSEINGYAHFCVGDKVPIGPWDIFVKARWWSCRRGTVIYRLNDIHDERRNSPRFTQEELLLRVENYATQSA